MEKEKNEDISTNNSLISEWDFFDYLNYLNLYWDMLMNFVTIAKEIILSKSIKTDYYTNSDSQIETQIKQRISNHQEQNLFLKTPL